MSRRSRIITVICSVPAIGLLALTLSTGTAFAGQPGGNPAPTAKPTPPRECPPGYALIGGRCVLLEPVPRLQQQEFDIVDATPLPNGWVLGTGPVSIPAGGKDVTVSSSVDILENAAGTSGVRINHEPLGGASVDRVTCSINLVQTGQPWSIASGFGADTGATGRGDYDLVGQFSLPTRDGRCTLPAGLTPGQAARDLNDNGSGLPAPLSYDISVQAVGLAAIRPHLTVAPRPQPCPTKSTKAPQPA
jgi:hypothetical protein